MPVVPEPVVQVEEVAVVEDIVEEAVIVEEKPVKEEREQAGATINIEPLEISE